MHNRFRWTLLLTLVVVSLVAAPLTVLAQQRAKQAFGLRGSDRDTQQSTLQDSAASQGQLVFPRAFAPVMDGPAANMLLRRADSDTMMTPFGLISMSSTNLGRMAPQFSSVLTTEIRATDAAVLQFGDMAREEIFAFLTGSDITVLGSRGSNFIVTGLTDEKQAMVARVVTEVPLPWVPLFFVHGNVIGTTPVSTQALAVNENLNMLVVMFPGADVTAATDLLTTLGADVQGVSVSGTTVMFKMNVHSLRDALAGPAFIGLGASALAERSEFISADEDTAGGIEIGAFDGGRRPYVEAGITGSGQIIGITDTGLSLDATVLADNPATGTGLGTPNAASATHRKVTGYTVAQSIPGTGTGLGDLLTCDGTTGGTHGHVVASIAAGNASELLGSAGLDICDLSGFEPGLSGCVTPHGVDGVAPGARISFVDAQDSSQCVNPQQIEAQVPGLLSDNSAHHATALARIHNYSFSVLNSEGIYDVTAADIDTWLLGNKQYLVVAAAGNQGVDTDADLVLDFGTVTSPGTAKNVLTVGSSGLPNNALDPENGVLQNVTNNGIEMVSKFIGQGSGQGPAGRTTQAGGTVNWRIKPDVMAPGDETLGNQRMTGPTTCMSSDNNSVGIECNRMLPGLFFGTSFSAAATSGFAALVRDYFVQGRAPAGQAGGTTQDLSGPELKAAIIASTGMMTGNTAWNQLGGQLQVAFHNPLHFAGFTPEQGYGRVQADRLLPLDSEPGTPSFIQSELISLALATPVTRDFTVLNGGENMAFVASWYDEAATAGTSAITAMGNLVDDVDMTVTDCGPLGICGDADDTLYFGNYFTEDSDFDGAITDIPTVFHCNVGLADTGVECDPGDQICLGGSFPGTACGADADCLASCPSIAGPDVCVGGTNAGLVCLGSVCDTGITDLCIGGVNNGLVCDNITCDASLCSGGVNAGLACTVPTVAADCPPFTCDDVTCTDTSGATCEHDQAGTLPGTQAPACGGVVGTDFCDLFFDAPDEDCNRDGVLDTSEFSLPIDTSLPGGGTDCVRVPSDDGARDRNNNNEKVRLSSGQLTDGRLIRVKLELVTDGGTPGAVMAGLVATGGFRANGAPNNARLNKAEFSCTDALSAAIIDGDGFAGVPSATVATAVTVGANVTIESLDAGSVVIDTETNLTFGVDNPGIRFSTPAIAVVERSTVAPFDSNLLLSVEDGGSIRVTYTDAGTTTATASATVRCQPNVTILNIGRRGTNANFNLTGGCDPRGRFDPRIVLFAGTTFIGTGNSIAGDLHIDAGEDLVYSVAFSNREPGVTFIDAQGTLEACVAGSTAGGGCTPAPGIDIKDPVQSLGTVPPGKGQTAKFNIRVASTVVSTQQITMRFGVSAARNGLTSTSEVLIQHLLETDTWSFPFEDAATSGVFHYSTDFPAGGQEIRAYAGEFSVPADLNLRSELFKFDTMAGSANDNLGDAVSTALLTGNNMPWTFDLDDEAWKVRRRFDSDPGLNTQLNSDVWRHNTNGVCGFQSNDTTQTDGQGGTGGIWHTGAARSAPPGVCTAGLCVGGGTKAGSVCTVPTEAVDCDEFPNRSGFDLGCEDYDIPNDAGGSARLFIIETVSSPRFFRVHQAPDTRGFEYTVEFTRLALNLQYSIGDGNAIFAAEIDPDTTTPVPVDPLDTGWLFSDQGDEGFLSEVSQGPFNVFNPNDPHDPTATAGTLIATPGPTQNILAIHGPGSAGSFFDDRGTCDANPPNTSGTAGNPCLLTAALCGGGVNPYNANPCIHATSCGGFICVPVDAIKAPGRAYGEVQGKATGRGIGSTTRRGAGGLPQRNIDQGLVEVGAGTFEDFIGPNETVSPDQTYPINVGNPQILVNRRDSYQANVIAWLREDLTPADDAVPDYGYGFDDVVVEWREGHPIADRTPCSDPATWIVNSVTGDLSAPGVGPISIDPLLAAGCAGVSWDRNNILDPETSLTLTVIDTNAAFGPNGIPDDGILEVDGQATGPNVNGLFELSVKVISDVDLAGEFFTLTQTAFLSPIYSGLVRVSSTKGKSSATDGILLVQENGDGTVPVAVTAQYNDLDIGVLGSGIGDFPCPDNPLQAVAFTQFVGADVAFVTAKVTDEGANADLDSIGDDNETVKLDISLINGVLDLNRQPVDLTDVVVTLISDDAEVGCILDGQSNFGTLVSGIARFNDPGDPYRFVVANVGRTAGTQVIQADFELGISGQFVDSLGVTRNINAFATPQRFSLNLDLDIANTANALASDSACLGGTNSGFACTVALDCPGLQGDGVTPATCAPLPAIYQAGGASFIAGAVGFCEGFEASPNMAGRNFAGSAVLPIPGTQIIALPAIRASGGYNEIAVRDWIKGGTGVLGGLTPGSVPGNARDDTAGSSTAVDGIRCQYHDPKGSTPNGRSENACRPWDGTEWHVNDNKAFSGTKSFYGGMDGDEDFGLDASFDTTHTNSLFAAFTPPLSIGVAGNATLSIQHIIQMTDDRTFNVSAGAAAGRGYIEAAVVNPSNNQPTEGGWIKVNGFQNNYGNVGSADFANCMFDSYDDFYDAEAALGGTPGWNKNKLTLRNVMLNADNVSNEDDYFDPNDPTRFQGPTAGCFPQFVYSSLGDYTSTNIEVRGKAFTKGFLGSVGTGVWINSLFNLDTFAGKTISLRFVQGDIDIGVGFTWVDLFGNGLGNGTRGWRMDDICVTGLVDTPLQLVPDLRTNAAGACPTATADNCGFVIANAGQDVISPVTGSVVQLSAAGSTFDSCVDGFLQYRWRVGATTVQDFSTNPFFVDTPSIATIYTVDVNCSTDQATCSDSDSVVVVSSDQVEVSGIGSTALTATGGGAVLLTGTLPQPAGVDFSVLALRVNLNFGGGSPAAAWDGVSNGTQAQALKDASCGLGIASPNTAPGGSAVTFSDSTVLGSTTDAVGYLQYAVSSTGVGAWGQLKGPNGPAAGRGSLNPTSLGFPAGGFPVLSGLPAGTLATGLGSCP